MFMELKNLANKTNEIKKFGIIIGIIFTAVSVLMIVRQNINFWIFALLALIFLITGICYPLLLKPVFLIWWFISRIINYIISRLVLTVIFYIIITPIGLISRNVNRSKYSSFTIDKSCRSYWQKKISYKFNQKKYEKQF